MKVLIGNTPATLGPQELLGSGGEADVYRLGALAVKVYHPIDPSLPPDGRRAAELALERKLEKVRAFPRGLPAEVVAPLELVTDPKGRPIGFSMRAIEGATEVLHLARRAFREGAVSSAEVIELFRALRRALLALHRAGVIAGDLNDGNVLFAGREVFLIDADSMQVPGHPCPVAHERFLDPRLYGLDLATRPVFDERSDWYAFSVMLFSSLLYVHPYGGAHPTLPTPLRRAEARHSVLRPDVRWPKAAIRPRVLPDALQAYFAEVFDGGRRGDVPESLLAMTWTRCACGLEHARVVCPDCASSGKVSVRATVRHRGACRATLIHRTEGRILAAAVWGRLEYLTEQGGVIRREDGSRVMERPAAPGMRFVIAGPTTWVARGRELIAVQREQVVARASTQVFDGVPSFDVCPSQTEPHLLLRLEEEWLMAGERRMGKISRGRTWIRGGARMGVGLYRIGRTTFAFVFRPGRPGLTDVQLPGVTGRVLEVDAAFDDDLVCLSILGEREGSATAAMYLIGSDGRIHGRLEGAPHEHRALASVRGKCVRGGRVLAATEEGIIALGADRSTGLLVEETLFTDTEPFVSLGAELLPGAGGSVYVVTTREITQLVLA